jgi:hypothetical protein
MKTLRLLFLSLVISILIYGFYTIINTQKTIADNKKFCCNNGQCANNTWCEKQSGYDCDLTNTHLQGTCFTCISTWERGGWPCWNTLNYYCVDTYNDPQYTGEIYPRYYTLAQPITTNPTELNFTANYGGSNPNSQTITIYNNVSSIDPTMNWSLTSNQGWLTLSPTSGTTYNGAPFYTNAIINITGLNPGNYSAAITVSAYQVSSKQNATVNVYLTINSLPQVSISGPSYLNRGQIGTFTAVVNYGVPPYSYEWYRMIICQEPDKLKVIGLDAPCDIWTGPFSSSSSVQVSGTSSFKLKVVVTDANNQSGEAEKYVSVGGSFKKSANSNEEQVSFINVEPTNFQLTQNYPNPFNPSTSISYQIPKPVNVRIKIFDTRGTEIKSLLDSYKQPGFYTMVWDGTDNSNRKVSSGVYFLTLSTPEYTKTIKMILNT